MAYLKNNSQARHGFPGYPILEPGAVMECSAEEALRFCGEGVVICAADGGVELPPEPEPAETRVRGGGRGR